MVSARGSVDAAGFDLPAWVATLPAEVEKPGLLQAGQLVLERSAVTGLVGDDWARDIDPYRAGFEIAHTLAQLYMDAESLVAGMLYRSVCEQRLYLDDVEQQFGAGVAGLVEGVLRISALSELKNDREAPVLGQADAQKDNIRKMLIAMVDDVRVVFIKLAERACAVRMAKNDTLRREGIAREVFDFYVPLAHRLGIGQLKWELEDLSFRYLYPEIYRKIAKLLDGKRVQRDDFIELARTRLETALAEHGIQAELVGRSKHIYSIWRKMQRKGLGFSQIYDIHALRILAVDSAGCYDALGVVHGLWRSIPNELDDYIANPKENGYRSLHTAVIGPEGKILEIQIRSFEMDAQAELGVCAHWNYKDPGSGSWMARSYEDKLAWLQNMLNWREETGDPQHLVEQLNLDLAEERIYVFTPAGDVVNLAAGATPLDFAYHVHTEVGHSCRGAKVNGRIVPLNYRLQTGQRVEIVTGRKGSPRRNWLQPEAGYLKTSRAMARVQQWFRIQSREDNVDAGRRLLAREFKRLSLTSIDYQRVAKKVQQSTVDDMYAAVGCGELSSTEVLDAARELVISTSRGRNDGH